MKRKADDRNHHHFFEKFLLFVKDQSSRDFCHVETITDDRLHLCDAGRILLSLDIHERPMARGVVAKRVLNRSTLERRQANVSFSTEMEVFVVASN